MSDQRKPRVDEDDDLDDLDDVLDQFSRPAQALPPSAGTSTSTQPEPDADGPMTDEFATKLAEEMASLFNGLGVESESERTEEVSDKGRLTAAWEAMLVEEMDSMMKPGASADTPKDDGFQSRIRSTMNKLKESESDLRSTPGGDDEKFASFLSQLKDVGGEGAETEDSLQGMLETVMNQLMSKDVLCEPLKELYDKFPEYIAKNSDTISPEDKKRYDAQMSCIKKLLDEFEAKTYSDDDENVRARIVELMGELQAYGSPPEEIMGPLPAGFSMGEDGLPNMPDGCNVN